MKTLSTLSLLFLFSTSLFGKGPWTEYAEAQPEADTAAAMATAYVIEANLKQFDNCRARMTPEYEAWLERIGGVETSLEIFIQSDLEQRFGYREVVKNETTTTIWIRVYVTPRGREVNVGLNLTLTDDGWKLTI